ncbi:MAG TPA: hypothetical protein VGK73_38240 [Polyangiaceae bacterium]
MNPTLDGSAQKPDEGVVHRILAASVTALGLLATLPAFAQANDNEAWDGGYDQRGERRSDFVIGVSPVLVLGGASGYPNEVDKIDNPGFEAKTGFGAGAGVSVWLGGALADWFTFGVGPTFFGTSGSQGSGSGGGVVFRVEAYPLYGVGGPLRDLAFFTTFGAGVFTVKGKAGERGEGGFTSMAGLGSAYELFRAGHFAFAPTVQYQLVRSQSLVGHQAQIGVRAVFYGGPG